MKFINKRDEYYKKLLDPRWQMLKVAVLLRDNHTCRICKDTNVTLHVHHEVYVNEPWDAPIESLKTLCFRCHEVITLCQKNKIKYRNLNRVSRAPEKFVYVVNTKVDTFGKEGLFAFVIHNLNYNSDGFHLVPFCFDKNFIGYMLDTF